MPSLRSRIILKLFRNRHIFQFKLHEDPFDPTIEGLRVFREKAEKGARIFGKVSRGLEVVPTSINDLYADWIRPVGTTSEKAILYFHGGGYVMGSPQGHRPHVSKFVKGTGIPALVFNYGLAPERPYPAGLNDSLKAYQFLMEEGYSSKYIIFIGDSAGGGLCLATLLAIKSKGIELPAAAVTISPWTDLKCTGESYRTKAKICLSPDGSADAWGKFYFGENDPTNPFISPLYGELENLPPLFIIAGEDEIHRDDAIRFAEKAKAAGVDVKLHIGKGMCHCYPMLSPMFPEAKKALEEMFGFITQTRITSSAKAPANTPGH